MFVLEMNIMRYVVLSSTLINCGGHLHLRSVQLAVDLVCTYRRQTDSTDPYGSVAGRYNCRGSA